MKFGHVNIVAHDWRRLVQFYTDVFGCVPVGPERNLKSDWLSRSAGVDIAITGQHLRLPGPGDNRPTLEIFHYEPLLEGGISMPNRPGFGHIAFVVEDVHAAFEKFIACGGSRLGEIAQGEIEGAGMIELVYCRDPEGNIVELQRWFQEGTRGATDELILRSCCHESCVLL